MSAFFALLALLPVATYVVGRRLVPAETKAQSAGTALLLYSLGLLVALPFLTSRAVGTGEAYNYSLATADAVLQMREGEIPTLAGQTEYAFNGRIHPLRTAPYLFYLGGTIDALTWHRLGFWELQNLMLAFSLMAAIHTCYLALRWGAGCGRLAALALAVLYGFGPAILSAVYWFDLFMTVHATPFLPVALAACLRQARDPRPGHDAWLAAALAAAWLAHPPVALWLTGGAGLARLAIWLGRPSWRELVQLVLAAGLMLLLAGYVFTSVFTLPNLGLASAKDAMLPSVRTMGSMIQAAFPGSLLPVPNVQNNMSNLQLGYGHWLLLGLALFSLWSGRPAAPTGRRDAPWRARLGLTIGALFLLTLTVPVPGVTPWLWQLMPNFVIQLTTIWPMQRLYLVATALIIFAAAEPAALLLTHRCRAVVHGGLVLVVGWTLWQSWPGLQRGLAARWTETATEQSHLPSNLDLTETSYAYLGTPAHFINGVMDPLEEFRLLRPGGPGIGAALAAALPTGAVLARGVVQSPESAAAPAMIRLEPHRRYLLSFAFRTPPMNGLLQITGPKLARNYHLPDAGRELGFGMNEGHRRSVSVWTSADEPEQVRLIFVPDPSLPLPIVLADYTLQAADGEPAPVVVHSLLPLRCTVTAGDTSGFLETCRRFLPDYVATVNGEAVAPVRSPDGQLMVPVPAGRSAVEIHYAGPRLVRWAFGVGVVAWSGLALAFMVSGPGWRKIARWLWRGKFILLAVAAAAATGALGWQQLARWQAAHVQGPIRLEVRLPYLPTVVGRAEPLVVTGRSGAGDFAYIRYLDREHVRFGFDHWGVGGAISEPIALDNSQVHSIEIRLGSLYPPLEDRQWADTPAAVRAQRVNTMELRLDGKVVLRAALPSHPTTDAEITVGLNQIGGSNCAEKFSGNILARERLPSTQP